MDQWRTGLRFSDIPARPRDRTASRSATSRMAVADGDSGAARTTGRLWVPESRRMSCDLLILVDEPAEAVVSFNLVDLGCCATGEWS